ncbi:hypothetical protein IIC38_00325 [candidate division KSB1 bacterium]|nr:hypothetical protein [candidate division KSB1 bacterium]
MKTIYFNSDVSDEVRRQRLYKGELFVYTACDSTKQLCAFAREFCEEVFYPYDPRDAQHHLSVEEYVEILKELKPKFIHHPKTKILIQNILKESGCDLSKTYFDVPRLRTSTAKGYLTSGLAYVFKPHRDIWYSPPMCQLNWWLPIYGIESDNSMAFHLHYWSKPVKNDSCDFNYQEWNKKGRKDAAKQVKKDTRKQSGALEPLELDPQIRVITEPGGLLIFSGAHLHSSVPNTTDRTRLSIDFRTVHYEELLTKDGAPNLDSACSGTTIRDYLRGSDLTQLPPNIIELYEEKKPTVDELSPQYLDKQVGVA